MFNREEGKTYPRSPMGGSGMGAELIDALQRSQTPVNPTGDLINRLLMAYNNKAYGSQAPMFQKGSAAFNTVDGYPHQEDTLALMTQGGDRLGFLSRDKSVDGVRYGAAIDNMGDPYRGIYEGEKELPFGTLDYGYDGDTVGAGVKLNPKSARYIYALKNALGL